ncbi:MAG: hypothetical protein R3324_03890, partial [Halobacteriales archaeon]|nr:hypothetical protein [Halobacteriales archaeon]
MIRQITQGASPKTLGLLLAGVLALGACEGENLFVSGPLPGAGGDDADPPEVQITTPIGDSTSAKPIGDSVLVTARVEDDTGIATVTFEGFGFRGDESLGTFEAVPRFETKTVELLRPVEDTTLSRYLIATPDSTRETAHLIVTATDTLGNSAADTVRLILGGPDVQILNLAGGETIQSGKALSLRILATDPGGVRSIEVISTGAVVSEQSIPITPVADSVTLDTTINLPSGVEGQMQLLARARNSLDVIGQVGPLTLNVTDSETNDSIPPSVRFTQSSNSRLELQDALELELEASDDNQGSGIARAGYTVIANSPSRGTSEVASDEVSYDPARTGNLAQTFQVPVFHADQLALPDTLIYEVTAWVVDAQGNCAASVGGQESVSFECETLGSGEIVAADREGL